MQCQSCFGENAPGAKYCSKCGKRLGITCTHCGHENAPTNRYCSQCGSRLQNESESPADVDLGSHGGAQSTPFDSGERRQATVLLADVSGYTAMHERLDPEQVEAIIDEVKKGAAAIIESHEGTANQFVGDEVVALFGIPNTHDDDPVRAVSAALELHEMVRKMSPKAEATIGAPLRLHTAVHTGLVIYQPGQLRDGRYRLAGDAVNTAARLLSEAKSDEILVSANTRRLISPYFLVEARDEVKLKGKAKPIIPYRVLAPSKIRSRFEAAEQRGFTKYLGRTGELATLNRCLDNVVAGRGQFITIVGEPGIGKSRLVYEFLRQIDRNKIVVSQGRCQSQGAEIPYLPFLDALRRGLRLRDQLSTDELAKIAVRNIKSIDVKLEQYIPIYLHLLSIPSEFPIPKDLQGKDLKEATKKALATFITAAAGRYPLVLILEDWHWRDDVSHEALQRIIDLTSSCRLLLIVTHRSDFQVQWGHESMHLKPLDPVGTADVVKAVFGVSELPEGLGEWIFKSSEGNPLFVEEACYSLLEMGAVLTENERARLAQPLKNLQLPDTVQAIIRARLDRLDRNSRNVVQLASVVGRTFSLRMLERFFESELIRRSLEVLRVQELVVQTRVIPEAEYTFKHVFTRDVAYETILIERRKHLHGRVGEALEDLYASRLREFAPTLAYQYGHSTRGEKAITFNMMAGDQAAELYARAEASTYFQDALNIARSLPASPDVHRAEIDAILKLAMVGSSREDLNRDRANLLHACALAESIGDERRHAQALYWLGRLHYVLAELSPAITYAKQSLEISEKLADEALAAPPVNLMGRVYWQLSEFSKSAEMLERSVRQMKQLGNETEESTAAGFASALFGYMGDFNKALSFAAHGIALAEKLKNPFALAANYHYRGIIRDQQGEWDLAIADYEKASSIAATTDDIFRRYLIKFMEGRAHLMKGDPRQARDLINQSIEIATKIGARFLLGQAKAFLAMCDIADSRLDTAISVCEEAITFAEQTGDRFTSSILYRTLCSALIAGKHDDRKRADEAASKAIGIQNDIGALPELGRSYQTRSILLRTIGHETEAARMRDKAMELFSRIGMKWDLSQCEQAFQDWSRMPDQGRTETTPNRADSDD